MSVIGGIPLRGSIDVAGSKNAALPAIAAASLARGEVVLGNVPDIGDVAELLRALAGLGVMTRRSGNALTLSSGAAKGPGLPAAWGAQLRASIYALVVSAVKTGRGSLEGVGGDRLPGRALDIHARAFAAHGYEVTSPGTGLAVRGTLRPADYALDDRPAGITGSATALLLAASCDGRSTIHGLSREPELVALAGLLQRLGAQLDWQGTTCVVRGPLRRGGVSWPVAADRVVWGTLAVAALVTGGEISLPPCPDGDALFACLEAAGASLRRVAGGRILVRAGRLVPFRVETGPYPKLSSDLLPPLTVLMAACPGAGTVHETVYSERFAHMPQLARMGVVYEQDGAHLRIAGGRPLSGALLDGGGIRETAALLLAAVAARGTSRLRSADDLWRGYADLPGDLAALGASVCVTREFEEATAGCGAA